MTLNIEIADNSAQLNYHFICPSFEFIDYVELEKKDAVPCSKRGLKWGALLTKIIPPFCLCKMSDLNTLAAL